MADYNLSKYPDLSQSFGILGIIVLITLAVSPVYILLNLFAGKDIAFLGYYLLSMGISFLIAHKKRMYWDEELTYNLKMPDLSIILLVSLAMIALQTGIVIPVISLIPTPAFWVKFFQDLGGQHGVFTFISVVIAAPILEEFIFRGIILDGLLKNYSPLKAIVLSSLLFGIVHLNPWQFVSAFFMGLFMGWVYYKTHRLILTIVIHLVNNLTATITGYFTPATKNMNVSLTESYGSVTNMIVVIAGCVLILAGCIYLIRKKFLLEKG